MTDERKRSSTPHWEPGFPEYSWLMEAAAIGRAESRRYWQQNDERHPRHDHRGWYGKKVQSAHLGV
jgi:hypothetical protein